MLRSLFSFDDLGAIGQCWVPCQGGTYKTIELWSLVGSGIQDGISRDAVKALEKYNLLTPAGE